MANAPSRRTLPHPLAARFCRAITMLVLASLPTIAGAQTSATASGTLHALAGGAPPQNYSGPFPLGTTQVQSGATGSTWISWMSTSAQLWAVQFDPSFGWCERFDLWASWNGGGANPHPISTNATATVNLLAPTGAGVRLWITSTMAPHGGSSSITVLGNTYTNPNLLIDAVVPPGGLSFSLQTDALAQNGWGTGSSGYITVRWLYPVVPTGTPTPGCLGDAIAWTRGMPWLGSNTFGITCSNAHPSLGGVSVIGLGGLTTPFVYDFVNVWVDPYQPLATLYLPSDPNGNLLHLLPIPIHQSFLGMTLHAQWLLLEPANCAPLGLSASNAIRITISR